MSEQAMKLFEALSDVDEELLERCNREKNKVIAYVPLWKYKKVMTACVCLLVVGVLSWGGYQLIGGRKGSAGSGSDSAAPAQIQDMAEPMELWTGAASGGVENASQITSSEKRAEEGVGNNQTQTTTEREQNDIITDGADRFSGQKSNDAASSVGAASSGNSATDDLQGSASNGFAAESSEAQADKEMKSDFLDSRKEIPWNTACKTEPFGSYLPTVIPAGYEPLSARQSSMPDKWNNMIFKWVNGEQILYLNMTVGEAKTKDEIRAEIQKSDGLYQYLAEDFKKDMIPDPIGGEFQFTLYYTDGMEIDIWGSITKDEMWELVESIQ